MTDTSQLNQCTKHQVALYWKIPSRMRELSAHFSELVQGERGGREGELNKIFFRNVFPFLLEAGFAEHGTGMTSPWRGQLGRITDKHPGASLNRAPEDSYKIPRTSWRS